GPERRRCEQAAKRDLDVVLRGAKRLRDALDTASIGRRGDEFLPQFINDEFSGLATLENEIEHGIAIEVAALAEHRFFTVVVKVPLARSTPQPVNARAASLMSRSL